jgi:hypothetical protein
MLAKNFFGILILLFNIVGLGCLVYLGALAGLKKISSLKKARVKTVATVDKPKSPLVLQDSIIPDEDDLLKDMDLSDLDTLNLDDFK